MSVDRKKLEALLQWYETFATVPIPKSDTLLTKLMVHGILVGTYLEPIASGLQPEHFQLYFSSSNRLVFVYKVLDS